jgi:hypothetical protein
MHHPPKGGIKKTSKNKNSVNGLSGGRQIKIIVNIAVSDRNAGPRMSSTSLLFILEDPAFAAFSLVSVSVGVPTPLCLSAQA